jgi:hypothetical protein
MDFKVDLMQYRNIGLALAERFAKSRATQHDAIVHP